MTVTSIVLESNLNLGVPGVGRLFNCLSAVARSLPCRQPTSSLSSLGMNQLVGNTGALGKKKELTSEPDVSAQPQLNGGTVPSAEATSKAEPSFQSRYSSNPSTAPAPVGQMLVPESDKTVQTLSVTFSA